MPRAFAKVNVAIWQDPDFRRLPPAAQHLYLLLWTAPELSFCGVHDWRPGRLSHLSEGFTEEHTRLIADCLVARHFLVTDDETEEVLIRSWARFDEVLKQPRLAISYVNAYNSTYSETLRAVIVHETGKMQAKWPELPCWGDRRVMEILTHQAVSAKDLPLPQDPFSASVSAPFGPGFALGLGQIDPKVWGSVSVPPTTASTSTTNKQQTGGTSKSGGATATRKRAAALPDDFKPSEAHEKLAKDEGVDLDREFAKFVDHWTATGQTKADWNATLRNWLRRAGEDARKRGGPSVQASRPRLLPQAHELELPPDGLSTEEYAAWEAEARARRQAR